MYLLHEGAINIGKYTMDYGDDIELKMLAHVLVEDLRRLSAAAWYPLFADLPIWVVFELIAALLLVKAHNRAVIDNDCSNALVLSFNNCHAVVHVVMHQPMAPKPIQPTEPRQIMNVATVHVGVLERKLCACRHLL